MHQDAVAAAHDRLILHMVPKASEHSRSDRPLDCPATDAGLQSDSLQLQAEITPAHVMATEETARSQS
jgi:hypothetical protein